ncbi:MAG: 4a-hydroxytetrahydrobiopterin dehydratase [Planctomycetota bacterium]|nr:4a-hydroxytetrahydrobiopterin dehydratase [Planctomycetota bacterium]
MVRPKPCTSSEIAERMQRLPRWTLTEGRVRREFRFPDFSRAFSFMTRVALLAEKADHHPDWSNGYGRVTIELSTHDAGGLTTLDFDLAEAIDRLEA